MILETDVDETQCPQQLVDVPVPQIGERIVAFHGSESRTSRCSDRQHGPDHTQKWRRRSIKDSQSHAASCERTGCKDCLKDRIQQLTSCEQACPASRELSGGEAVQDHQEHQAEKESDHPGEDPSGEFLKILKTVPSTEHGCDHDPTGKDQSV